MLFNEIDLRTRWTKMEINKFRKDIEIMFYYFKQEDLLSQIRKIYKTKRRKMKKMKKKKKMRTINMKTLKM